MGGGKWCSVLHPVKTRTLKRMTRTLRMGATSHGFRVAKRKIEKAGFDAVLCRTAPTMPWRAPARVARRERGFSRVPAGRRNCGRLQDELYPSYGHQSRGP